MGPPAYSPYPRRLESLTIISLETVCSTQSNCPNSVSVNAFHNLVELKL